MSVFARRLAMAFALLTSTASVAEDGISLVAVGDLILSRPISMLRNPGALPQAASFASVLDLLADADVTTGNMETSILDVRRFHGFPYSWDGDWMLTAEPGVPDDLRAMGFDILSRANNHALDWGAEGMRETIARLDAAGLVSAGSGESLAEASAPAILKTGKGNVAIVSMVSTYRPATDALDADPAVAPTGRPGVNPLAVTQTLLLDAAERERLHAIACSFQPEGACATQADSRFFGKHIRTAGPGETPFSYAYTINSADLARNAASVAAARPGSRLVLATIHAHEATAESTPPRSWQEPAGFLRPLAHQMIDAGADAFLVTGIHHVAGIEIYRGRPIFYGLGNFFWSDMQIPLSSELYGSIGNIEAADAAFQHPDRMTDSDLTSILNAGSSFAIPAPASQNRTFQTVLTRTDYEGQTGNVSRIRLYPIDLGYGDKLTQSGIPRRARQDIAHSVLDRIIALSDGDSIRIEKVMEGGYLIGIALPVSQ